MLQALVQALLYAHVLANALIWIFFSPGLSLPHPLTENQTFLTSASFVVPTWCPPLSPARAHCCSVEGMMGCCPKLKLVLILSALHRTGTGWHERDVSIPQKKRKRKQSQGLTTAMHQRAASVHILMGVWGSYHLLSCHRHSEFTRSGAASAHCAARMHEHESKMGATTKPQSETDVLRCSHLPHRSENPAASVRALGRPPLPPPLLSPNPSWISMRNFREMAVWEMPEFHRYQTYESCQFNLWRSPLTFDWRMSSELNSKCKQKQESDLCWIDFQKWSWGFLTNQKIVVFDTGEVTCFGTIWMRSNTAHLKHLHPRLCKLSYAKFA